MIGYPPCASRCSGGERRSSGHGLSNPLVLSGTSARASGDRHVLRCPLVASRPDWSGVRTACFAACRARDSGRCRPPVSEGDGQAVRCDVGHFAAGIEMGMRRIYRRHTSREPRRVRHGRIGARRASVRKVREVLRLPLDARVSAENAELLPCGSWR